MAEIKGADLLAKSLKEQGVEYMFGVESLTDLDD